MTAPDSPPPRRVLQVPCPTCGRASLYSPDNPARPFCSERCRSIDLGAWASDQYRVAGNPGEADPSQSPDDAAD